MVRGADREATVGTVAARCERAPVVACPDGHGVPPDVGEGALEACHAALPRAARRRLARTDRCGACDEPLTMPVRRTERPVTLADLAPVPVTTLRFDLPTTRCPACGVDQVPTRSQDDLDAVVRALFSPGPGPAAR